MSSKNTSANDFNPAYKEKRHSYRVVPDKDNPAILFANNRIVQIKNIGAAGALCYGDNLAVGQQYAARINLPRETFDIRCDLDVLEREQENFRTAFIGLTASDVDKLHRYISQRQRETIVSYRAR